ncbi:hypothetical protein [Leifsonia sp. P73]|uniref:hypothetical protein n=1 Tax=Leifsonia sp. P73 TaxID=3423959 RepID=UPI003DA66C2D
MTQTSPLDTLKHTALRVENLLGYVIEQLVVDHDFDEDDPVIGSIESARKMHIDALAEHIPGVAYDPESGRMRVSRSATSQVYRYDDGSPVCVAIEEDHLLWQIFPRLDQDLLDADKRRALRGRPLLRLVEELSEGEDG